MWCDWRAYSLISQVSLATGLVAASSKGLVRASKGCKEGLVGVSCHVSNATSSRKALRPQNRNTGMESVVNPPLHIRTSPQAFASLGKGGRNEGMMAGKREREREREWEAGYGGSNSSGHQQHWEEGKSGGGAGPCIPS